MNIDYTYLVGEHFYKVFNSGKKIKAFKNFEELKLELETHLLKNATILIKGSRGMALERVLDLL